jgi:hypothetical protein
MGHQASICIDMADAGKLGAASPLLTVFGVASTDQSQALPAVADLGRHEARPLA